jgi:hypothetical protein
MKSDNYQNTIANVVFDNQAVTEPSVLANNFNNFFANLPTE